MVLPHLIYKSGKFIFNSNPEVKISRETHNPLNESPIHSFRKSIDKKSLYIIVLILNIEILVLTQY